MIGVDTNVLVRYLVNDDVQQSQLAQQFFQNYCSLHEPCYISSIVLCELVWVLESAYRYSSVQVADVLQQLIETQGLEIENLGNAWQAVAQYRKGLDFSDALIGLNNQSSGCSVTLTFDKKAAQLNSFKKLAVFLEDEPAKK